MSTWTLIQIVFNIFMACGLFVVIMRMNRAPKDDPRLSRGLALLQSKIAVLEDLSDRTEHQVSQLVAILESKAREVQAKVELAERHVHEIRVSMDRSLEVASIFQDKIPHKEIIERQNTIKYVQAARLAHDGVSTEEIASRVDLPRGELDFIVSVNKDRLMFTEDALPEWAKSASSAVLASPSVAGHEAGAAFASDKRPGLMPFAASASATQDVASLEPAPLEVDASNEERANRLRAEIELAENQRLVENLSRLQVEMQTLDQRLTREISQRDLAVAYDVPRVEVDHLKKLGDEFRKAVREGDINDAHRPFGHAESVMQSVVQNVAHNVAQARRSMLPPLENLSALIPSFLEAGDLEKANSASASGAPRTALGVAPRTALGVAPRTATAPVPDPVLARAAAQAKVQAALRLSSRPSSINRNLSPELHQARAVARDLAGNVAPAAKPGEVRKVMFPRIDGSEI